MKDQNPHPLLWIANLPGHDPTLRMRAWRARKVPWAALRDGPYPLPNCGGARDPLAEQAAENKRAGESAHLVSFDAESAAQARQLEGLFERAADFAELTAAPCRTMTELCPRP